MLCGQWHERSSGLYATTTSSSEFATWMSCMNLCAVIFLLHFAQELDGAQTSEGADGATGWRFWEKKQPLKQRFKKGIPGGVKRRHRRQVVILGETKRPRLNCDGTPPLRPQLHLQSGGRRCQSPAGTSVLPELQYILRLARPSKSSRDCLVQTLGEPDFEMRGFEYVCATASNAQSALWWLAFGLNSTHDWNRPEGLPGALSVTQLPDCKPSRSPTDYCMWATGPRGLGHRRAGGVGGEGAGVRPHRRHVLPRGP